MAAQDKGPRLTRKVIREPGGSNDGAVYVDCPVSVGGGICYAGGGHGKIRSNFGCVGRRRCEDWPLRQQ